MDEMLIGVILGFCVGSFVVAGVFYAFYIQVSSEIFDSIAEIKKTVGWLGTRIRNIAHGYE